MAVSRLGKGDRRRRIDLKTGEQGIGREIDSGCGSSEVDDLMTSKGGEETLGPLARVPDD